MCAHRLCPAVPAVAHAVVALTTYTTTCSEFKQCTTKEAVTGCANSAVDTATQAVTVGGHAVCGMYGAAASVTCKVCLPFYCSACPRPAVALEGSQYPAPAWQCCS